MGISEIFPHHLYSFHYDGQEENEFRRLFSEWNDIDYLLSFFRQHISFLDKDIWSEFENEPENAAKSVIIDANKLEPYIQELEENTKNGKKPDFDSFFQPFDGKYTYVIELVPMKAYGMNKHTFLRLYAIKLDDNCYLIIYGGLKLGRSVQDSPILKDNVIKKIDWALYYLKQEGIYDGDAL